MCLTAQGLDYSTAYIVSVPFCRLDTSSVRPQHTALISCHCSRRPFQLFVTMGCVCTLIYWSVNPNFWNIVEENYTALWENNCLHRVGANFNVYLTACTIFRKMLTKYDPWCPAIKPWYPGWNKNIRYHMWYTDFLLRQCHCGTSMTSYVLFDRLTWCRGSVDVMANLVCGIPEFNFLGRFCGISEGAETHTWWYLAWKPPRHAFSGISWPKTITPVFLLPQKPHECVLLLQWIEPQYSGSSSQCNVYCLITKLPHL
jgi:hypothetical protein